MKRNLLLVLVGVVVSGGCSSGNPTSQVVTGDAPVDDLPRAAPASDDWPWWRGPSRNNHAHDDARPPVAWSDDSNLVWKVPVPGMGHASPCVWGETIYLATADLGQRTQSLVALERETGRQKWSTRLHQGGFMFKHPKNSYASSTAACDGTRVFAVMLCHGALWATAVDLDGRIVWQKDLGKFKNEYGYGASPVIYKSLVIVAADHGDGGMIVALHRESGETAWRTKRSPVASYVTPVVAHVSGRPQLMMHGGGKVTSYDPDTGRTIWSCDGPSEVGANTVAAGGGLVYVSGGYPERNLLCIRPDGRDDVTATGVMWTVTRRSQVSYVPSPLWYEGNLYVVHDTGTARCFDAATGTLHWQHRLGSAVSSSPVAAAGRIYVVTEEGTTFVFKSSPELDLLATNALEGTVRATPVLVGRRIYLRTTEHLYCIGAAE